jgi:hypothetical protein
LMAAGRRYFCTMIEADPAGLSLRFSSVINIYTVILRASPTRFTRH